MIDFSPLTSSIERFRHFSLFEAVRILTENHVHRLPIVDPISNNVIFILTHKRILRFFYLYVRRDSKSFRNIELFFRLFD